LIVNSIAKAAGLSAREDDRKGVRLRKYAPPTAGAARMLLLEPPHEAPGNDNCEGGEEAEAI
jgi:hypothetical protein